MSHQRGGRIYLPRGWEPFPGVVVLPKVIDLNDSRISHYTIPELTEGGGGSFIAFCFDGSPPDIWHSRGC